MNKRVNKRNTGLFLTSHVFIIASVVPVLQASIWNLIVCRNDERSVRTSFVVEPITLVIVQIRFLQMATQWEYFDLSAGSSRRALLTLLDISLRWINVGALSRPDEMKSDKGFSCLMLARLRTRELTQR